MEHKVERINESGLIVFIAEIGNVFVDTLSHKLISFSDLYKLTSSHIIRSIFPSFGKLARRAANQFGAELFVNVSETLFLLYHSLILCTSL